jgi:calcium-dependent protein kinase
MHENNLANRLSFFDEDDLTILFEFKRPNSARHSDLFYPAILKSTLFVQFPNFPEQQEGFFALHNNTLVCYKDSTSEIIESVLELSYARINVIASIDASHSYGFSLTKNGNTYEFYTADEQTANDWVHTLKQVCVFTRFHDDYKALKMIGNGTFAKVYLAESKRTKKMYAVKAFTKENIIEFDKINAKPLMLNEINIMRSFDHENVVKLYEVYESERSVYLVLELVQGKSLQDIMEKPFSKKESSKKILNMMHSILDVLTYMASKGVMHRDLKPENILLDKDFNIKVADFGLATQVDVSEYLFKKCGTPGYIAPEVFSYDQSNSETNYDDRSDVFSVGCIFFYLLFGYPLFNAKKICQVLEANKNCTSEFEGINIIKRELNDPNSKISKDGLDLLLQLIEVDPKKRITAAQALSHPYFTFPLINVSESQDFSMDSLFKSGTTPKSDLHCTIFNLAKCQCSANGCNDSREELSLISSIDQVLSENIKVEAKTEEKVRKSNSLFQTLKRKLFFLL